jgi:2-iminobutanoate/2-iminopropanoate deaminase
MNEIYGQYFRKDPPVRTTVQVARLPFDILLEIDVIAYIPK